jgi:hypothetical protein
VKLIICLGLICFFLMPLARASATLSLVAAKDDPITNGTTISSSGSPAIDEAGDVAFRALLRGNHVGGGNNVAILYYQHGTPIVVAREGDVDPITGAKFIQLSDPVLNGKGALLFLGRLKPGTGDATQNNSFGVWLYQSNTFNLVVRTGTQFPAASGHLTRFKQIGFDDFNNIAVLASVGETGVKETQVLFAKNAFETLSLATLRESLVVYGNFGNIKSFTAFKPLPCVGGQSRSLSGGGAMAVLANLDKRISAILLGSDDPNGSGVGVESSGQPALFTEVKFREPIINNAMRIAFNATIVGEGFGPTNNDVIEEIDGYGPSYEVVRRGDLAPDASGAASEAMFSELGDPVLNNNGKIAFIGSLKIGVGGVTQSNARGIWSDSSGVMKQVVRQGELEPGGSGGKFADFNQIVLPDIGGVIVEAKLSGVPTSQNHGLWAVARDGSFQRLVQTGQTVNVQESQKKIKNFRTFQTVPYFSGQTRSFDAGSGNLAFHISFSDGSWGIFQVAIP